MRLLSLVVLFAATVVLGCEDRNPATRVSETVCSGGTEDPPHLCVLLEVQAEELTESAFQGVRQALERAESSGQVPGDLAREQQLRAEVLREIRPVGQIRQLEFSSGAIPITWLGAIDVYSLSWRVWGEVGVLVDGTARLTAVQRRALLAEFESLARRTTFSAVDFCQPGTAFSTDAQLSEFTARLQAIVPEVLETRCILTNYESL